MTRPIDNLDQLVARVAAGRLDDLTPEQVAALEAHLNSTPEAAGSLANVIPRPEPHLPEETPRPTPAEWNMVWERIEATSAAPQPSAYVLRRAFRLWRPLAAAAACVALLLVWRAMSPAPQPSWNIELSEDVVVHEVEVFGDASAFVAYSEDGGAAAIWVLEESNDQGGA